MKPHKDGYTFSFVWVLFVLLAIPFLLGVYGRHAMWAWRFGLGD